MNRRLKWLAAVTTFLSIPGRDAAAQFNVIGPGSTVQGDHWRGWGAAATGEGWYNHLTALARAADADTDLRLGAAAAQAYAEQVLRLRASLMYRHALVGHTLETRTRRSRSAHQGRRNRGRCVERLGRGHPRPVRKPFHPAVGRHPGPGRRGGGRRSCWPGPGWSSPHTG